MSLPNRMSLRLGLLWLTLTLALIIQCLSGKHIYIYGHQPGVRVNILRGMQH
jgi:hypothetical protein